MMTSRKKRACSGVFKADRAAVLGRAFLAHLMTALTLRLDIHIPMMSGEVFSQMAKLVEAIVQEHS